MSSLPPFRRVTATPQAHFVALSRLLDLVCSFQCDQHKHRATVEQIMNGRISYAGCCEDLLEVIDRALRAA